MLIMPCSCLLRPSLKPRATGPANRCTIANVAILTLAYDESPRRAVSPQSPLRHHFIFITNINIKSEYSGRWSHRLSFCLPHGKWRLTLRHIQPCQHHERGDRISAVSNVAVQHAIFLILRKVPELSISGDMVTRQYHETMARDAN